ncbi:MAG: PD40 domain-containing protein [Anaerolineae bacterium]|nr:PD40 domain-containing protein [Anaerolineae bacterium]
MKTLLRIFTLILSSAFVVSAVQAQEIPRQGTIITTASVRKEASTQTSVLVTLPAGTSVTVLAAENGQSVTLGGTTSSTWYKVRLKSGIEGYIWSGLVQLETTSPNEEEATPLPVARDESLILTFSASSCDNRIDIYSVQPDGSHLTNYTSQFEEQYSSQPTLSPDGHRIAYFNGNIAYVINISDNARHVLLDLSRRSGSLQFHDQISPLWSPDGRYIAYVVQSNNTGQYQVAVTDANGGNFKFLGIADPAYAFADSPVWSPDSRWIAFTTKATQGTDIVVTQVGGSTIQLTHNKVDDRYPAWSPDSQHVAYVSETESRYAIFVSTLDGKDEQLLENSISRHSLSLLTWSPDGQYLAYVSDNNLLVIQPDSTDVHQLTDSIYIQTPPLWSPDSKYIAVNALNQDGSAKIFVINADGSNLRRPAANRYVVLHASPAWGYSASPTSLSNRPVTGMALSDRCRISSSFSDKLANNELIIDNGLNLDAVVVLKRTQDELTNAVYVRSGDKFTLMSIANGDFDLFYMVGQQWDDSLDQFTVDAQFERFANKLTFNDTGRNHTVYTVTLHPVQGGTAQVVPIPPEEFPKIGD